MPHTNETYRSSDDNAKNSRRRAFRRPMTFFLIIVAIIFIMGVFFKISVINVEGNVTYTAEEIISASGIHTGDNLFFINRIGAGSRIAVKLPYVESVRITRSLPNIITIKVDESKAVACIEVGDELWSISRTGKFLNTIDVSEASLMPRIKGIEIDSAKTGDQMEPSDEADDKLDYLIEILYQIQARGLVSSVGEIDITDAANPVFEYDGRFIVKLGARDDTEYKFGKLLSAVSQLMPDDSGTMDLYDSNKVSFRPN